MNILVTAASRHGSTDDVGRWIASGIAEEGHTVEVVAPAAVASLDAYDAVVCGSAVYVGRWLGPARELVERSSGALKARPVYLFSVGPLGEPPAPAGGPTDAAAMIEQSGARQHQVFGGQLQRERLGFGERTVVNLVRAPDGDYRDRAAVESWARAIGRQLAAERLTSH